MDANYKEIKTDSEDAGTVLVTKRQLLILLLNEIVSTTTLPTAPLFTPSRAHFPP